MQVSGNHESSTAIKEQIASNQGGASANAEKQQFSATEWQALVGRIQAGDELALEQLYNLFGRGVRYYLYRQLGPQELEDRLHDTFLIVVRAIQRADLREPERLMGFVRTVVRRQVAAYIDAAVQKRREQSDLSTSVPLTDHNQNPEREAIDIQNEKLMQSALAALSERDRDILLRFYLLEQSQEQICREMELNATQFRLLKSRAKAKFGEIGRKKLAHQGVFSAFARATAS